LADYAALIRPTARYNEKEKPVCRNIRTLFNFEPPATEDEIRASALQFVRKLSGFTHPSRANEDAFNRAVDEVSDVARRLLVSLSTASPAKNREAEAIKGANGRRRGLHELGARRLVDLATIDSG
jgi:hypothetical protein